MRFSSQKSRKNNFISVFRARKSNSSLFGSGKKKLDFVHNRSVAFILGFSVLFFTTVVIAESGLGATKREESFVLLPGQVSSTMWHGDEQALIQDVGEEAVYQNFSTQNAAMFNGNKPTVHIPAQNQDAPNTESEIVAPSTDLTNPDQASDLGGQTDASGAVLDEGVQAEMSEDDVLDFDDAPSESSNEPVSEESVPAQEPAPVSYHVSPRFIHALSAQFFALIAKSGVERVYAHDVIDGIHEQHPESISVETQPETLPVSEVETPAVVDAVSELLTESVEIPLLIPPSDLERGMVNDLVTTPSVEASLNSSDTSESTEVDIGGEGEVVQDITNTITFTDFGLPVLQSGQFIRNVQLRMSLAGMLKSDVRDTFPSLQVTYTLDGETWVDAGMVLLDGEVSNALNGGYYLFAMPKFKRVTELENFAVRVNYVGDVDAIDRVYVDSAWLQVDTEIFDRAVLKERVLPKELTHLELPTIYEILSTDLDFTQVENPKFSLKYESQRNVALRFIRDLFGRKLADVQDVRLTHTNTGPVPIKPQIDVTDDGLITVQLTDEDRKSLQPGEYTLEIEVNEGGKVFSDSFNFQWGMLAINPNKAQYVAGEEAQISLGAITRNGNTLCDANLLLYVIDPEEYISEVDVLPSGQCNGNNVIDVPDYSASFVTTIPGTYTLYVERVDASGEVLAHTSDTFIVATQTPLTVERTGPTRIYPPSPYPMQLTIHTDIPFTGTLVEYVPRTFVLGETDARVSELGDSYELAWDVSLGAGESRTVSYMFDAPDLSPYLYRLGPARVVAQDIVYTQATNDVVGTTSTESIAEEAVRGAFTYEEHRFWQIASDATGNMLLFWDNANGIPTGWTCVSCNPGDPFYQRFIQGSSTYNNTGGSATHTHNASSSLLTSSAQTTESGGANGVAIVTHTHTFTPTIGSASNLPVYRDLQVIQYTASAGEPASIPTGAIGMFDATLPSGWTTYSTQNGYFMRGENTVGTTGGASAVGHAVTGTTGASTGGTTQSRGPTAANGATIDHTHSVSTTTSNESTEPPYITVMLGQLSATATAPNGLVAMWTDSVPTSWVDVSSGGSDVFNQKFLRATSTYGSTGGSETHTHSNMNTITTSVPSATNAARAYVTGTGGASDTHTHTVTVTNFTTVSNLPPYVSVIIGKRQGTNPVFTGLSYRWYANATSSQTPTDPWPRGAVDLAEGEALGATTTLVKDGDVIRLRINTLVGNATATASTSMKLQFGSTTSSCGAISSWSDVGAATSSAVWRGYNNTPIADHGTLTTSVLASTTVNQTYEENGYTVPLVNQVVVGGVAEWDFVLEQNGASAGTQYCFRMLGSDGTVFSSYSTYPSLLTNYAPNTPTLSKLFDNEKTASTSPWFEFVTTDPESEDLNYQIQIDNDFDFTSTVIDHNTTDNDSYFENLVTASDKDAFTSGELMRYTIPTSLTNGVTYWWRVRARDPEGSNQWGEWVTPQSFTIDTALTASAWFQTTEEQFDTSTLVDLDAVVTDQIQLATGSTTGTYTSDPISFDDGTLGTAWGSLAWNDTETTGDIKYTLQYRDTNSNWANIPDADLPGNSTGFDTSPVSLLDLDTDTYGTLRIVATFTNSGGSPSLQDITLNWGYRVETPTISKLFPNEKVGTTTPTFEFETTDPQGDSLTYQISWSTDNTFAASTTRTSDTHAGFTNADLGSDLDPFNSGQTIRFKVQGGDALTNNATYWWRVRAKDTTGDDAYSLWTAPQSFTVDTTVVVSTWFQTTQEQFDSDILSGTVALSTDLLAVATTATEAMLVYGEGVETQPRYREWDGSSWSTEATMNDVGAPVRWAAIRAATTREEYVAVTQGTDGDINAQVFSEGAWGDLQEMTATVADVSTKGFDVAYETLSGDAMVAYCDGDADPSYYIWNGSTWTSGGTINLASTNNCEWIRLASDPVSDEIIILAHDGVGGAYEAQVWTGSAWGNSTTQGSLQDTDHEGMAVEYEESGGQAIIITSDGNPARFRYNTWSGATWSGVATQAIGNDFEWGDLVQDDGSDELALCYIDDDLDVGVIQWNGATWDPTQELSIDGNSFADQSVACAYETTSGRDNYIMTVYSNSTSTDYNTWNNTVWSPGANISTIGDSSTMSLIRTGIGTILGIFFDDPNDSLLSSSWNGSVWSSITTIESDASVNAAPFGRPYALTPRNSGRAGTIIVSPGIDFTDGSGPYWDQMSWVDSTPGTSDILYQVQYYDTASATWKFIPDTDLPGNSAGTSTSPIDLSNLNINTYNLIRPYAALSCDGSNNCPTLSDWTVTWAEGITVSGTLHQYDQISSTTSGTLNVAVDGVLQVGKTGTVSNGSWSISNVTAFAGDIITVFVEGANDANEAVGVTRYDGIGNVTGLTMYERHLTLGSDDATTTPLTNVDIGVYDNTNDEDLFHDATSTTLTVCAESTCTDAEITVKAGTRFEPRGSVTTHDFENNGTFLPQGNTITLTGSWDNNATTTFATSTFAFTATSTLEIIDNTGAVAGAFYNLTFGTSTSVATWTPITTLDIDNNLTVATGTLARDGIAITVGGNLLTGAGGFWSGLGTTTFDGSGTRNWADSNPVLQNIGRVVIDGSSKTIQLTGNVAAQSITIGSDDILDVTTSNYDITVYSHWINNNTFLARSGEVFMAATTTNRVITAGGDAFYDLTFTGVGGSWSFTETDLSITNDFRVNAGVVTLPTGTTTLAGSWNTVGGIFAHNNGTLYLTSASAETIAASGTTFTNHFYNMSFEGSGSWSFLDTRATTSNDFRIKQGTVTFPGAELSVGGHFANTGGTFNHNSGTVNFNSASARTIDTNASFNSLLFSGLGSWSFVDTSVTALGSLTVTSGTVTLPSNTLTLGGSISNTATITHNNGTVLFNSTDTGETINLGSSPLYNMTFNSLTGGWTITGNATTSNNFTLATTSNFTLSSGLTLAVGGTFTNAVRNASTTWSGSILSLEAGAYTINAKTNGGDTYDTLRVKANTDIKMWNSSATTYVVDLTGSLYSQDHAGVDGDLYVFGSYERTSGSEYWSYATDFDGTVLTASTSRQVDVRLQGGASASILGSYFEILGGAAATTTIDNQGSGVYTVFATTSTTTFTYYDFNNLGTSGVTLAGTGVVTSLNDGVFRPGVGGGTGLSVATNTINANPGLQIYRVNFSTTSAISSYNVTQYGGVPASFWWFRDSSGNIDGEAFDNDTGDPGSIRWDDSSLIITISGVVYGTDETTPLPGSTCDGSTQVVRVVVNGDATYTGSCAAGTGAYSIPGVVVVGDPVLTVYLDTNGGPQGTVITRTPTGDINDLDIYQNRVVTRHEDTSPLTILNMAVYDSDNDADIRYSAATGTLTVFSNTELHIASSTTFVPGGDITILANASNTVFDGSLHIDDDAVFTGAGTSTYTIGGSFTLDQGATFTAASTSVVMNATTTGKTITTVSTQEIGFNTLTFNGVGGGWNINGDVRSQGDILVTNGTVSGTGDVTIVNGSFYGDGVVSMGAGTTTVEQTNTLGGNTPWTFANLVLGSGLVSGTTTPASNATTTVSGKLTISTAHFLNAHGSYWNFTGSGNVFIENGTFVEGTSTVRYSGVASTNVISTTYYNLDLKAVANAPTYTATGLGIIVTNALTVGGPTTTTFTLDANDPAFDVNGTVTIDSTGTLVGSGSGSFTVAGNWDNNGTYTPSGGTVTFDGAGSTAIAAGNSAFANVTISGSGSFTVSESATATNAFTLTSAGSFIVSSGQSLAVGITFTNSLGGAATTWTGSVLYLYGGGNYQINASTTSDSYDILRVAAGTQIRMWNSDALVYDISGAGSLYSQDHAAVNGDLYIYGAYTKTSGTDFWSYNTDFDGTVISGSPRNVDVYIANGASVVYTGGGLSVLGDSTASTTIQNQGSGTYSMRIGGTASTTWSYYQIRNTDSTGLTFSGTPNVATLSYGNFEVAQNSGSAITVGGSVISQNQAKTFTNNYFGTSTGVSPAYNVTATGTTVSSWRFTNHAGMIDGEAFDVDPNGDPGYIAWDDSAALITITGNVYSDEGSAVSSACDGVTPNIRLQVAGLTGYTTSCNAGTGLYTINNVAYSPGDALIVYIDGETEKAATVSEDPISNINNMDLYENRVVLRHESTDPLSIADMAVWDSSDDADIPFTATLGSPNTLLLPADRKLIVWTNKEFEPNGNVTVNGGGGGAAYDGTLELFASAVFDATGSETHTIGGSLIAGSGAIIDDETSTFVFTTSGAGRTVDSNDYAFYNLTFSGSGSWTVTNTALSIGNDFTITQGAVTLPSATTTISGSLSVTGGSFVANGGTVLFNSSGTETIRPRTSSFGTLIVNGTGSFSVQGGFATTTGDLRIIDGTFTSATGTLSVGRNFINGDVFTHGSGILRFTATTTATVTANGSDLFSTTFAGGGSYRFTDTNVALLGSLSIESGAVTLATGTMSIGGSFLATDGTFNHSSGTILFNSSDTGETINPGTSAFHAVTLASAGGGWTIAANATTTGNFSLTSATSFTQNPSTQLTVQGVFTNLVGGAATTWTGSTLAINSGSAYTINTKLVGGDTYNNVVVGSSTALRAWDSAGTITMSDSSSSFYSQDHAGVSGALYIFGNYVRTTGSDYWSYATDFDGASLSGSERQVFVYFAANATTSLTGGALNIVGSASFDTTISNQGSGTFALSVFGGTLNAQYYSIANLGPNGLYLTGTSTTITSLSEGNFTLAVNGGSLITLASSTLNYNAGLVISGASFATTSAITGYNVNLIGTTPSVWTFTSHSGNFDGENFDNDGGDACGSVRWDDSSCLLLQQSAYRFRHDDGGEGVPNSEWYDLDWTKRKRVSLTNPDAVSYTNATVEVVVAYDGDMQTDFDDLRFTSSDGTTLLSHYIETYTASTEATVWVEVPLLATSTVTEVYMYYGNGGVSDGSASSTFITIDNFEDGNISEYSGDTSEFTVSNISPYERTYRLNASDPSNGRTNLGGMYNNSYAVAQGQKIRFLQYIDASQTGDETCMTFATQSQTQNYGLCLELFGVDRMSISRNVLDRDTSGTVLGSTTVTYSTGWYEVEIAWDTDDTIFASLYQNDTLVATTSATDGTYTSGGIGFTLWTNHGGWDFVSSRALLQTEPSVAFGFEQVSGGASWREALNTPATGVQAGDVARVRFLIENTGLAVTDQNFEIEFASKGNAPSCEAVDYGTYVPVPDVASCGTSDICMNTSTYFTNLASTTDLLGGDGTFTFGQIVEDPSNSTGNIDIDNDYFTELEYAVTPTVNATESSYCLRVTNAGSELDAYSRVAELQLLFAPNITSLSINGGGDIVLVAGTTTTITATGTVSDQNGWEDIVGATTTMFRSGVGESCTADNNNCYIAGDPQCSFTNCAGDSCDIICTADFFYHADPTDTGTYAAETWRALLRVIDTEGSVATATAPSVDLLTLNAIAVNESISYGALTVDSDTGSYNATTTIENIGNNAIDIGLEGTDLTDGGVSAIPVNEQKFATSTFTYNSCVFCSTLTPTSTTYQLNLSKPTSTTPSISDEIFWGIAVPFGVAGTPHQGVNTFYPVSNIP